MAARRAVFFGSRDASIEPRDLVRDGRPFPPAAIEQLEILPEAQKSLCMLRAAGFPADRRSTNQPEHCPRTQTIETVELMNRRVKAGAWVLDAISVLAHDDSDHCTSPQRAPHGLLLEEARSRNIDRESQLHGGRSLEGCGGWTKSGMSYKYLCLTGRMTAKRASSGRMIFKAPHSTSRRPARIARDPR